MTLVRAAARALSKLSSGVRSFRAGPPNLATLNAMFRETVVMAKFSKKRTPPSAAAQALSTAVARRLEQMPRPVLAGDTAPSLEPRPLEQFVVRESIAGAQDALAEAV